MSLHTKFNDPQGLTRRLSYSPAPRRLFSQLVCAIRTGHAWRGFTLKTRTGETVSTVVQCRDCGLEAHYDGDPSAIATDRLASLTLPERCALAKLRMGASFSEAATMHRLSIEQVQELWALELACGGGRPERSAPGRVAI